MATLVADTEKSIKGYAEGYYGRLFTWPDRLRILDSLQLHGLNTYYYAPKEDAYHRYQWRRPYSSCWRQAFREFCAAAKSRQIQVIAGVAPGLDFDFAHLPDGDDFQALLDKSVQLINDGASALSLLMDDIDADFPKRRGEFDSEGRAHASLANALAIAIETRIGTRMEGSVKNQAAESPLALWVTPRIYADELNAESPCYLPDFIGTLRSQHLILYCGSDVVARQIDTRSFQLAGHSPTHQIVIWDNLYANDYCPRRLFIGPWQGREFAEHVLLNPTGQLYTDCLLLELMAVGFKTSSPEQDWWHVLLQHGVPESFKHIAPYLYHPVCNDSQNQLWVAPTRQVFDAIEECLWRWKTPLSREWYPYLFGLKHDLLACLDEMPALRIEKTQTQALAHRLLGKQLN